MGGASHCTGRLEMKHQGEWKPGDVSYSSFWNLQSSSVVCRQLDCGSAVSTGSDFGSTYQPVWRIVLSSSCVGSLKECGTIVSDSFTSVTLKVICSGKSVCLSSI